MERHRLTRSILLGLGLMGVIAGCGAMTARSPVTQESEELFTPKLVAGGLPTPREPVSGPSPEANMVVGGGPASQHAVRTAIRLVKEGEYAKAIALLEPHKAAADFSMLHTLGVAYVRTERNEEAYGVLLRAHRLNPSVPGPLLPAALACARVARRCDEYRRLAQEYKALGGRFTKLADKIADHQPLTLVLPKRF